MKFKREHQKTHFYKYVSSSTAKRILENGSFLSRCPLKFNDPFDVWKDEKEWRIWDLTDEENESDHYITLNFKRFEAIY